MTPATFSANPNHRSSTVDLGREDSTTDLLREEKAAKWKRFKTQIAHYLQEGEPGTFLPWLSRPRVLANMRQHFACSICREYRSAANAQENPENARQSSPMCLLPRIGFGAERASIFRSSTLDVIQSTFWKD